MFSTAKSYFSERKAKLWYQNLEIERKLNVGCPQGSSCGPWYWNISYDDIFDIVLDGEYDQIKGFCDDTRMDFFSDNIKDLEEQATKALQSLCDWAKTNKLKFNASKTVCVLFTKRQKYDQPKIKLQNQLLNISTSVKYLGVYVDSKLSWKVHANYVKTKASQLTMNLITLAKQKFGLNSKALETIYKGAILPTISYCSSVWYESLDRKYVIKPLASLQRQVGLRLCKAYKTVSTEAINILANLMPIDLYLKQTAAHFFIKKGINNSLTESYFSDINLDLTLIQKPFKYEELPHFALRSKPKIVTEINDRIIAFTDGSKSEAGVGSAFCILDGELTVKKAKYKMANYCSVFQSELFAILNTLSFINKKYFSSSITVCSDSLSAIKAIENVNSCTQLVQQIFQELRTSTERNIEISFSWIRGHNNTPGNELADSLAKEAAKSHNRIAFDRIPVSYAKRIVYEKNITIWNERWTNSDKGEMTRNFFPSVFDRAKSKKFFAPNFHLSQILTNHGKLNKYLTRFRLKNNSSCDYCQDLPENADHIIFHCERYNEQREELIAKVEAQRTSWPCAHKVLIYEKVFETFKNFCDNVLNNA